LGPLQGRGSFGAGRAEHCWRGGVLEFGVDEEGFVARGLEDVFLAAALVVALERGELDGVLATGVDVGVLAEVDAVTEAQDEAVVVGVGLGGIDGKILLAGRFAGGEFLEEVRFVERSHLRGGVSYGGVLAMLRTGGQLG
jgi:hypothetical protein